MSRAKLRLTPLQTALLTCFCYVPSTSVIAQSNSTNTSTNTSTYATSHKNSTSHQVRYSLNIPSLPLTQALQTLAKQSQQNIHLTAGVNSDYPTQLIQGNYSIEQALEKMLPNLSLKITRRGSDANSDWVISEIELPSISITAKKDRNDKQMTAAQFNLRESLAGIVRYETLISAPSSVSGSGNIWDSNGNAGYSIRGIEGNRIALEIDGIALPDAAPKPDSTSMNSFAVGRDYFDPELMQEVNITTANTNANQSAGLGGKVSFRSKAPSDYLTSQRTHYLGAKIGYEQQNSSQLASVTGAWGNTWLQSLLALSKRHGKQIKTLSNIPSNPDDWNSIAALGKLDFNFSDSQSLLLSTDYFQAEHHQNLNTRISPLYPKGVMQQAQTSKKGLSATHQFTGDLSWLDHVNTKLYFQDAKQEDQSRATYVLSGKTYFRHINTAYLNKLLGLRVDAEKQLGTQQLSYGFKWEQSQHERPWHEQRLNIANNSLQVIQKNRMAEMKNKQFSLYLNHQSGFSIAGKAADISTGLRYEQRKSSPKNLHNYLIHIPNGANEIKEDSAHALVPNLSLNLKASDQLTSYIQWSQNTRFVSAAEKTGTFDSFSYTGASQGYAILGNPALKNERNSALEFGFKHKINTQTTWNWKGFYNRYQNFIEYTLQAADPINYPNVTNGLFRPENLGQAQTWGMELQAQHHFSTWQGSRFHAAIGNANGRIRNTKTAQENFLASVAPLKASFIFSHDAPNKLFGFSIAAVANKGKRAANDVLSPSSTPRFKVPAYARFDLSGYWNIQANLKLSLAIDNLSNKKYWDYGNSRKLAAATNTTTSNDIERLVMPGRSASLNLQYHF